MHVFRFWSTKKCRFYILKHRKNIVVIQNFRALENSDLKTQNIYRISHFNPIAQVYYNEVKKSYLLKPKEPQNQSWFNYISIV